LGYLSRLKKAKINFIVNKCKAAFSPVENPSFFVENSVENPVENLPYLWKTF
jgi:hypothetical protein